MRVLAAGGECFGRKGVALLQSRSLLLEQEEADLVGLWPTDYDEVFCELPLGDAAFMGEKDPTVVWIGTVCTRE